MISGLSDRLGINRVVLALSMARLGDAIGNSILIVVIPLFVAKLPSPWFPFPDTVRVGILIALYGFVNALLQPLMGAWSDRLGTRKPLIMGGLLIVGIATFAFSLVGSFSSLLLLRVLQGIGVALTIPASLALLATATQKRTRGGAMGVYSASRMVGFAAGPLIGGYLYERFGFNISFYAGAAFIALGALLVQLWVREKPRQVNRDGHKSRRFQYIDVGLLSAGIIGAAIATFIMASDFSMISALENEFNARLGQGALGFGFAFSAMMIGRVIFQIPLGRWSDIIGRRPLIIGGMLLMAPATYLLAYVATTLQFVGVRAVQGIASAAIAAPAFALAADLSSEGGEGRQMSIITMGFGLGIAAGPLIAGILAVHSFWLPFLVGGILSLIGAWIVFQFVPETVNREAEAEETEEAEEERAREPEQMGTRK